MLDDSDLDLSQEPTPKPPRRSGNRSFLVVAGILGAIMLLALVGLVVYALVILPQQQAAVNTGPSPAELTSTAVAHNLQITNTPTRTSTPTRTPTNTATPRPPTATNTPVTPLFTNTSAPTSDSATQTVAALLTQAALAQTQAATSSGASATPSSQTPTATASALPQSGFGDSSGAPLMLAVAAMLVLVIIAVRRLRSAV
jgi:cytoskeletal protein RodZ